MLLSFYNLLTKALLSCRSVGTSQIDILLECKAHIYILRNVLFAGVGQSLYLLEI